MMLSRPSLEAYRIEPNEFRDTLAKAMGLEHSVAESHDKQTETWLDKYGNNHYFPYGLDFETDAKAFQMLHEWAVTEGAMHLETYGGKGSVWVDASIPLDGDLSKTFTWRAVTAQKAEVHAIYDAIKGREKLPRSEY